MCVIFFATIWLKKIIYQMQLSVIMQDVALFPFYFVEIFYQVAKWQYKKKSFNTETIL